MKYIYLLLLLSSTSYAKGSYYLVDLEKMEFNYARMDEKSRDPFLPEYTGKWKERTSTKFRMGFAGGRLYWDNNVHGETTQAGVFTTVGWHWELGMRITDQLSIFHEHHSRHVMEKVPEKRFNAGSQFPVEDSWGIKLKLIKETTGKGIL